MRHRNGLQRVDSGVDPTLYFFHSSTVRQRRGSGPEPPSEVFQFVIVKLRNDRFFSKLCISVSRGLRFHLRRGQDERNNFRLKPCSPVCVVAKRLIRALAAPAQRDCGASGQVEFSAVLVKDFKIPFDADTSVILDDYFCRHFAPFVSIKALCLTSRITRNQS